MSERILCVDDDSNVLAAYKRALHRRFQLDTAEGGEEALAAVAAQGPYAVVVADMRMPEMNGVELLARLRALAPDTVRMMLTGNADQQTALEAVNEGHIFRFLTKPCPPEVFAQALEAGIRQYHLITAERELLSKTLAGAVRVLTDVLTLVSPVAFGRATRVRRIVAELCREMGIADAWRVEMAAMLSQIGCVAVPENIIVRAYRGEELSGTEQEALCSYPRVGRDLLAAIPRLEQIAEIVGYQEKLFNGRGFPPDYRSGEQIPVGSRVLKLALDWDTLISGGLSPEMALAEINDREGHYDPRVLEAVTAVLQVTEMHVVRRVMVNDLVDGMILAEDVRSLQETLLCSKGQEVTTAIRTRLRNYAVNIGIPKPIKVFVPMKVGAAYPLDGCEYVEETTIE